MFTSLMQAIWLRITLAINMWEVVFMFGLPLISLRIMHRLFMPLLILRLLILREKAVVETSAASLSKNIFLLS